MPMSPAFERRLTTLLPDLVDAFGTPFHIYDAAGIDLTCEQFSAAFAGVDFRQFFAIKALPNPSVLRRIARHGFGFDTSCETELTLAATAGATGDDICFTSCNTSIAELLAAIGAGAAVTIDDEAILVALAGTLTMPPRLAFRVNPGDLYRIVDNHLYGDARAAKFGVPVARLPKVCAMARELGVRELGLHMMVASNVLEPGPLVLTLEILLDQARRIEQDIGVPVTSVNVGGGIGIPYRPDEQPFDIAGYGAAVRDRLVAWTSPLGDHTPTVRFECGRYITGPHGALVTRVVNRMDKWQAFVGVDANMTALMRPALYSWAYHHISAPLAGGLGTETVTVVGSLPENRDRLGEQRRLPSLRPGDIVVVHDTGAHGHAMGFNYTGRPRPQELMLHADGSVELIRRAEADHDLFATLDFEPRTLPAGTRKRTAVT
jgi:diaminopimelate decarboxylase